MLCVELDQIDSLAADQTGDRIEVQVDDLDAQTTELFFGRTDRAIQPAELVAHAGQVADGLVEHIQLRVDHIADGTEKRKVVLHVHKAVEQRGGHVFNARRSQSRCSDIDVTIDDVCSPIAVPGEISEHGQVRVHVHVKHDRAINITDDGRRVGEVGEAQFVIAVAVPQTQAAIEIDRQRASGLHPREVADRHLATDAARPIQAGKRHVAAVSHIERRRAAHEIDAERDMHIHRRSLCLEAARQLPVNVAIEVTEAGVASDVEPGLVGVDRAVVADPQQVTVRVGLGADVLQTETQRFEGIHGGGDLLLSSTEGLIEDRLQLTDDIQNGPDGLLHHWQILTETIVNNELRDALEVDSPRVVGVENLGHRVADHFGHAIDRVDSLAAVSAVDSHPSDERVIAITAEQRVITGMGIERIGSESSIKQIVSRIASQRVITAATDQ